MMNNEWDFTVAGFDGTYRGRLVGTEDVPDEPGTTINSWLVRKPCGETYGFFAKGVSAARQMVASTYG